MSDLCRSLDVARPYELLRIHLPHTRVNKGYTARSMTRRLFTSAYCFIVTVARGRTVEAKKPVPHMGTYWVGGASGATGYRVKIAGGGERGNKSEGFAQEVHRRHSPLGRRGPQRRLDRKRPRYEPFVGAVVPFAQRNLPSRGGLDIARSPGFFILRRCARAYRSRRVVRPRDRQRPALAETLEEHREGGAAPHTDQDRAPQARGRQGPVTR